MALIDCIECSKEMSDKAKSCPNCGAPNTSLSFGSRTKKIAKAAGNLVIETDQKIKDLQEAPSTKSRLRSAKKIGRSLSFLSSLILVYFVVRIFWPFGPDYYERYARNNSYDLPQCKGAALIIYDQGWQRSSPTTHSLATAQACAGYIDAVNERLGTQSGFDTPNFNSPTAGSDYAFLGIDRGCRPTNMPTSDDTAVLYPLAVTGEDLISYQDGKAAFARDQMPMLPSVESSVEHVRINLRWCGLKLETWNDFTPIDFFLIKMGLPSINWWQNQLPLWARARR
jgi:hypothetical protein